MLPIYFSKKLNNYDAYVDAHTNLAVLLANFDCCEESYSILLKAIELQPENDQAQLNFGDVLR